MQDAVFRGDRIEASEAEAAARWIASRQGLPGAYGGTFAGFEDEREEGIIVFTGERITSASARHILGEETCRTLRRLGVRDRNVSDALARADAGLMERLARAARDPRNTNPGLYCCGKCSVGMWRNLLSGGLDRQEERLAKGVRRLREVRNGGGEWAKFPFWYTVLALAEMDFAEAAEELRYARERIAKALRRRGPGVYAGRRRELATRLARAVSG